MMGCKQMLLLTKYKWKIVKTLSVVVVMENIVRKQIIIIVLITVTKTTTMKMLQQILKTITTQQ